MGSVVETQISQYAEPKQKLKRSYTQTAKDEIIEFAGPLAHCVLDLVFAILWAL
mgnify:CR=1 FL=1